jgi:lysophospholipase L1-like esterase
VEVPGTGAVRLHRVPESVRDGLEEPARLKTLNPGGAEIRFVINSGKAKVTLSSAEDTGTAMLFHGTFVRRDFEYTIGREPVTLEISAPESDVGARFESLPDETADTLRYHPRVCRIVLRHGNILLHDISGDIRPPEPSELPEKTMLAYGTSITHGAAASAFHLTYVAQTAWRLGTDLLNFGVGGACRAEAAFGDYLAQLDGWDFATLALSVNMIGAGFTLEEFHDRTHYLIGKIAGENPSKPIFCISIYPYFGDWGAIQASAKAPSAEFRRVLEEVVNELDMDNLHFIPGPEILTDISGLTVDMIHPGDLAMINMGENLASKIELIINRG